MAGLHDIAMADAQYMEIAGFQNRALNLNRLYKRSDNISFKTIARFGRRRREKTEDKRVGVGCRWGVGHGWGGEGAGLALYCHEPLKGTG